MIPHDYAERQKALDFTKSYIVQAPAGSGKTELLTQRFLTLLANAASNPEEIIAITFTRKAAAEMRHRILAALSYAQENPEPKEAHKLNTWQLAKKVLHKNTQLKWHIIENPNRLKITTIDSFCRSIVGQLPILSQMGSQTTISDNCDKLYHQAAQATLKHLKQNDPWYECLKLLLIAEDNDYERAENLIVNMLKTREQWLSYIGISPDEAIHHLTQSLANIITQNLESIYIAINQHIDEATLLQLINYANNNLNLKLPSYQILPEPIIEHLPFWIFIADLLITKDYKPRKTITKNQGFPAITEFSRPAEKQIAKQMKANMKSLLLSINENTDLINALSNLMAMPMVNYYEDINKKEKIFSLFKVIELAYAELRLLFKQTNLVDFTEISLSATSALQAIEDMPEINLILDYKLKHILIDEFQDTSRLQFSLFENLTKEWFPNDGKTLFLVGDPMQSIYRFRQAEVGLFIQVQSKSINNLDIIPLQLTCNFRSNKVIIDWVNQQFIDAFPASSDIASGAIHYSSAMPMVSNQENSAVFWHIHDQQSDENSRALETVKLIQKIQSKSPNASIAVLARKRKHLLAIIQVLNLFKLKFNAVDVESLMQKPLIHDLIAMTAAFNHLGDKLSWLSLLRAPIIALSLNDILIIAEHANNKTVHQVINEQEVYSRLHEDSQSILLRVLPIINFIITERERFSLKQLIEHAWIVLGGDVLLQSQAEQNQFKSFLSLLERWDNDMLDYPSLREALTREYATTENQTANLQLMTIHKSKGLEFDYVIVPELHDRGQFDSANILAWHEQPTYNSSFNHNVDWLLAPKKAVGDDKDKMYQLIRKINQDKSHFENTRLLYVAVTRAKKGLHLCYQTLTEDKKTPPKDSLLYSIWNKHLQLKCIYQTYQTPSEQLQQHPQYRYEICPREWTLNKQIVMPTTLSDQSNEDFTYTFSWEVEQHIGSAYHLALKLLADNPKFLKNIPAIGAKIEFFMHHLLVPNDQHIAYTQEILITLEQVINTARGQWLFKQHQDSHAEYAISLVQNNKIKHYIIDRTFIDDEQVRWIIDYKTTYIDKINQQAILHSEWKKYQMQLRTYASFFDRIENNKIKLALYYPKQQLWIEKSYEDCLCPLN